MVPPSSASTLSWFNPETTRQMVFSTRPKLAWLAESAAHSA